tara:strand:+ start:356 stop:712 length:357 start_codon:yes stop_codon:yes gene_type:complete
MANNSIIFHMCKNNEWQIALVSGIYNGSSQDVTDGFIHFSTADQILKSAEKHHNGQHDLVLLSVKVGFLGGALRWEKSRGGDLFPHLYGSLPIKAVIRVDHIELGPDGLHKFPQELSL